MMGTNIQGNSDHFEPVELWVHYTNEGKADLWIGFFMTAEELADAYVEAREKHKDELEQEIVELVEENE